MLIPTRCILYHGASFLRCGAAVESHNQLESYVVDLVLLLKYKVSIPKILLFSAGTGLVLFGVLGI